MQIHIENIRNQSLKTLAKKADEQGNKNGFIDLEKEISCFGSGIKKTKISDEAKKEAQEIFKTISSKHNDRASNFLAMSNGILIGSTAALSGLIATVVTGNPLIGITVGAAVGTGTYALTPTPTVIDLDKNKYSEYCDKYLQ